MDGCEQEAGEVARVAVLCSSDDDDDDDDGAAADAADGQ